jgi:hypothetical protein
VIDGHTRSSYKLRLTHPAIDFWVDVRMESFGPRWLAVADLASTPEIGVGWRPDLAVLMALWPLGASVARQLATEAVFAVPHL